MRDSLQEQYRLFKRIASKQDLELLNSENASFEDFERLGYILNKLQLDALENDFFMRNCCKFQNEINEIEAGLLKENAHVLINKYEAWLRAFSNRVPLQADKNIVNLLFEIQD